MHEFDPSLPGLIQGDISEVILTEPAGFAGGLSNRVVAD